jgi:large repetitive protein
VIMRLRAAFVFAVLVGCDSSTPVEPLPTFDLSPSTPILFQGMSIRLAPASGVASGKWSSSNQSVVSVDGTGLVLGAATGSATVRYTTDTGFGETAVDVVEGGGTLRLGYQTTCAVSTSGGTLYCWGNNSRGQVGIGSLVSPQASPVKVNGSLTFTSVSPGADSNCGMTTTGPYCWGRYAANTVGDGSAPTDPNSPVKVRGGDVFTTVETNGAPLGNACSGDLTCSSNTCGLTAAGIPNCWEGTWWDPRPLVFAPVANAPPLKSISVGMDHDCGIDKEMKAYCWGATNWGVSGTFPPDLRFQAISAGRSHTCAIEISGDAYCFGLNTTGQLGASSTETCMLRFVSLPCRATPVKVDGGFKYLAISASSATPVRTGEIQISAHTCAITVSQDIVCWGFNGSGQLGNGTHQDSATPVKISSAFKFRTVTTGFGNTCALTTTGTALCWGANESGELGIGGTSDASIPTAVTGGLTFK